MRLSLSRLIDQALAPAPPRDRIAPLLAVPFAHRGLHGGGRIENSRAAFTAAIAKGHGIELDVQASREGDAFVIHDYELERLTGHRGAVADLISAELRHVVLSGSEEAIPALPEILQLVASRVPLLIEVKAPDRHVVPLCLSVFRALEGYRGPVGVMSFNPEVGRWLRIHAPRIVRGLVITESGKGRLRGWAERRLALWRTKPDFLAYDVRNLPSRFAAHARSRGLAILTWTVRDARAAKIAAAHADQIIYEAPPA
jgi:glycerophosphoryl diester phosphodiesterase